MIHIYRRISFMKLREITPKSFKCGIGACPAIFKTDEGSFVIIGKQVGEKNTMDQLDGKIGPDEIAVEIPGELLQELNRE